MRHQGCLVSRPAAQASCQWNCVPLSFLSTTTTRFSRSCLSAPLRIRTKKQRVPGVDYYWLLKPLDFTWIEGEQEGWLKKKWRSACVCTARVHPVEIVKEIRLISLLQVRTLDKVKLEHFLHYIITPGLRPPRVHLSLALGYQSALGANPTWIVKHFVWKGILC